MKLTRREEEVLGGVMRSLANKEIAASLNLSERTVKFHVSSLLTKFRVRGRMELVREATRRAPAAMGGPQPLATREARLCSDAGGISRRAARWPDRAFQAPDGLIAFQLLEEGKARADRPGLFCFSS